MEMESFRTELFPPNALLLEINRIRGLYIQPGSVMEININGEVRNNILERDNPDKDIFSVATKEIYYLLSSDLFSRWASSPDFEKISNLFRIDVSFLIKKETSTLS